MFGPPGHAYVYFTYGMHFCVNLVCLPEGTASAVLLRAGRVIEGAGLAAGRAAGGRPAAGRDLARGPARLCQALGIDRSRDGADVCDRGSPLRVLAGPGPPGSIGRRPQGRPTAQAAGQPGAAGRGQCAAAERPWRFWLRRRPDGRRCTGRTCRGFGAKPVIDPRGLEMGRCSGDRHPRRTQPGAA